MDITKVSILHHAGIVLLSIWALNTLGWCHPVVYLVSLVYLCAVNECYTLRLRRRLQFEERKRAHQKRLLSDAESVRWLNHAIEKVWPICLEQIASQKFFLPIIPWFLDKYKPWTARKAVVKHLCLGRKPPMLTEMRVLSHSADGDDLVLELGMIFHSGEDMSAALDVKLRKRLGFGIRAKMHVTGMRVEGKVLVGVRFLPHCPFLGRVRLCFVQPPYFQMTVKPIFSHGLDVTEIPGIAGWLDNLLAVAFEETLVEPNMLVVDVEKFVADSAEGWFTVDEKHPVAVAKVEIVEAADMKPSDINGHADPYVKGQLGSYRFQTNVQKKTLSPKWDEEFKIPIISWEASNVLVLEVRDKDYICNDMLGDCSVNIGELRGGQRHDKWLPLRNIKMGRLHLAITILEGDDDSEVQGKVHFGDKDELSKMTQNTTPTAVAKSNSNSGESSVQDQKMSDEYEPINIEGQEKIGIWVHRPGSEVSPQWECRRGRVCSSEPRVQKEEDCTDSPRSSAAASGFQHVDNNSNTEHPDGNKVHRHGTIQKGLKKIGSVFHSSPKSSDSPRISGEGPIYMPRPNQAVGEKGTDVKLIVDDLIAVEVENLKDAAQVTCSPERDGADIWGKGGHTKDRAKSILKQVGKSAHDLKSALSRKGPDRSKAGKGGMVVAADEIESISSESSGGDSPRLEENPPLVDHVPMHASSPSVCSAGDLPADSKGSVEPGPMSALNIEESVSAEGSLREDSSCIAEDTGKSPVKTVSMVDSDQTLSDPKFSEDDSGAER